MDEYPDFRSLALAHAEDRDFRVRVRRIEGCPVVVVAPHGGSIEPGTSEIAAAIAAEDLTFCTFEGIMPSGNRRLHITSTRFDEPRCLQTVQAGTYVLAIHGEDSAEPVVFLGGRDAALRDDVAAALTARGFVVRPHVDPGLQGTDRANLCNRGRSRGGVQLELSAGLRRTLFQSLSAAGRKISTPRLAEFASAIGEVLLQRAVQPRDEADTARDG